MEQNMNIQNMCSLQAQFSVIMLVILWAVFSFALSVTYVTAFILPVNFVPFQIYLHKIQQGVNVPLISYLKLLTTSHTLGIFSDSIETVMYI